MGNVRKDTFNVNRWKKKRLHHPKENLTTQTALSNILSAYIKDKLHNK